MDTQNPDGVDTEAGSVPRRVKLFPQPVGYSVRKLLKNHFDKGPHIFGFSSSFFEDRENQMTWSHH